MTMCWFKKKKKENVVIDSKYIIGESVMFRNPRGDLVNGYIYEIRQNKDSTIVYDVQVGGECPIVYESIPEDKIIKSKR